VNSSQWQILSGQGVSDQAAEDFIKIDTIKGKDIADGAVSFWRPKSRVVVAVNNVVAVG